MHQPNRRPLRFEGLEDRRLAAGINFQYTNLFTLQQQTASKSVPAQQSTMTFGSFKASSGLAPGISVNHNQTLICLRRRSKAQ